MISIDDFKKVEMKIGIVLTAEKVPDADKLLKLSVDFGLKPSPTSDSSETHDSHPHDPHDSIEERDIRQVVSGIALFVHPEDLIGKTFPFVTNLEPRTIRGLRSEAMILAVGTDSTFSLLRPATDTPLGSQINYLAASCRGISCQIASAAKYGVCGTHELCLEIARTGELHFLIRFSRPYSQNSP